MAGIQKNFKITNGLEVNENLIFADKDQNTVGIGTTVTVEKLQVSGGIGATSIVISGIATIATFKSTDALISNGYISVGIVTTLSGTDSTYTTSNSTTLNATTGNIVTGVVTSVSGTDLTYTNSNLGTLNVNNLYAVSGLTTNGTIVNLTGTAATITSGAGSVKIGIGTTALVVEGDARVTGILTVGTSSLTLNGETNQINGVTISSGIVTATTFSGDVSLANGSESAPSIKFSSSTTTGIYSPGTNQFAIATAGSARITIDASGNIVAGGTLTAGSFIPTSSTVPTTGIYSPGTNQLAISTNGAQRINIEADGDINIDSGGVFYDATNNRLAIGTQSPSEKLTVNGSIDLPTINTWIKGGGHNVLQVDATKTYFYGGTGGIQLRTADNVSDLINITNAGLVGIGTSSPQATLHVKNTTEGDAYFKANSGDGGADRGLVIKSGTGLYTGSKHIFDAISSGGQLEFRTAGSSALFIDQSQRVGIGTTSPTEKLTVSSSGGANIYPLHIENTINFGWGVGLKFRQALTNGGGVIDSAAILSDWESNNNSTLEFSTTTAGSLTEKARIDSSGRLLVGTSSAANNTRLDQKLAIVSTGSGNFGGLSVTSYCGANAGTGPVIDLQRSKGTTDGSLTEVVANDLLGYLVFRGSDGATFSDGAHISGWADGDWTTSGDTTDSPGRLVFSTTADGASSPTERMRIDSSGRVGIGTQSPAEKLDVAGDVQLCTGEAAGVVKLKGSSFSQVIVEEDLFIDITPSDGFIAFRRNNGASESCRIDGSGRLLVGTSTARSNFFNSTASSILQVEGNLSNGSQGQVISHIYGENAALGGPYIFLGKHRSGSIGGTTVVANNDQLGAISFAGADGTEFVEGARIQAFVDGTPGANDMPGRLVFSTTADGASSPTERLRITSAGLVGIGTSAPGYLLDLRGTRGNLINTTGVGAISALGDVIGGIVFTPSDGSSPANDATSLTKIEAQNDYSGNWDGNPARNDTRLVFYTSTDAASTAKAVIDSSGRLGIGITSPGETLTLNTESGPTSIRLAVADANDFLIKNEGTNTLKISSPTTDFVTIDSSGRLLVGTSSSASAGDSALALLQVQGNSGSSLGAAVFSVRRGEAATAIQTDEAIGIVEFGDNAGNAFGVISCVADANAGSGDYPGRLVFSTTADGASSLTERMRIKSNGDVCINGTDPTNYSQTTGDGQIGWNSPQSSLAISHNNSSTFSPIYVNKFNFTNGVSNNRFVNWYVNGSSIASITTDGSSIAYNTTSDYRLKENIVPLTGATDRLQQIPVYRFNFITDPDKTVDGFLAHEAQAVVPECVTGTKDEVDDEGNPVYQGIDQSKLVPLLTAALQETIAELQALKAEVAALKAS